MNTKVSKYIAFTLAFVVLISSIGIAQVHHICQMAIAGMEQESCNDSGSSLHDCCAQINIQDEHAENNCCSNEVTYFQNKINTVVQESLKLTIYITVAENFQLYSFRDLENSLENFSFFEYSNLFSTGNNPVYINIQSFLI